jgi:hypothetical protein
MKIGSEDAHKIGDRNALWEVAASGRSPFVTIKALVGCGAAA